MQHTRHILALLLASLTLCAAMHDAHARGARVVGARIGARYLSVGWSAQPGLITTDQGGPSPALAQLTMATLGFHQLVTQDLAMSVEAQLGAGWLRPHGAAPEGVGASQWALSYQVGLFGRWLIGGAESGPTAALGVTYAGAQLDEAPARMLSLEPRLGWLFWSGADGAVWVELGYAPPVIQGLSLPLRFDESGADLAANAWRWHRATLTLQWSF